MYQEEQQDKRQSPLTPVCLHDDNVMHRETEDSVSPAMQYNTSHHITKLVTKNGLCVIDVSFYTDDSVKATEKAEKSKNRCDVENKRA